MTGTEYFHVHLKRAEQCWVCCGLREGVLVPVKPHGSRRLGLLDSCAYGAQLLVKPVHIGSLMGAETRPKRVTRLLRAGNIVGASKWQNLRLVARARSGAVPNRAEARNA